MYEEAEADAARQLELNSTEEVRYNALVLSARYLQGIRRYHDHNIQERSFNIGDLVIRRIQDATLVMGRAFHHLQDYKTRVISTTILRWPRGSKLLEYRAPTPFLPLDNLYTKLSAATQHFFINKELVWYPNNYFHLLASLS
jgi:hypothetical protein